MEAPSGEPRFSPRPRRTAPAGSRHDTENALTELRAILRRTEIVRDAGRAAFADGQPAYDVASMVIIRLASLLERPELDMAHGPLSEDEVAAIRTTRNIVAHAGYRGMNDDLFWAAVTVRVPDIVRRLLEHLDDDLDDA